MAGGNRATKSMGNVIHNSQPYGQQWPLAGIAKRTQFQDKHLKRIAKRTNCFLFVVCVFFFVFFSASYLYKICPVLTCTTTLIPERQAGKSNSVTTKYHWPASP